MTAASIPFLDLHRQNSMLRAEVTRAMESVMEQSAFISGPFTEKFENEFAAYCGVKRVAAVSSGTSALHLALLALGIRQGDEVLVPANTFIATAWGATHAGATPVFVDCTAGTWNMDAEKAEEKITIRTKAIIGVHLYGQPCDIKTMIELCKKHRLHFVEDAAQAHGAVYAGKKAGAWGDLACFSFYPGKNLGAYGDAGAVATDHQQWAEKIKILRNQGSAVKYYHDEIGFNERMDGLQAAILSVKLRYLDRWNARRKEIARMYLKGIVNPQIKFQQPEKDAEPVFHLFVVTAENRNALIKYLNERKIYPGLHYPLPLHLQKAYAHLGYKKGDFPQAEYLSEHCLSLPMFPELTDEEVLYVIDVLNSFKG